MRAFIRTLAVAAAVVAVLLPAATGGQAAGSRHVYWTNTFADTIGRANVDGTGADQGFITGATRPEGVAVDSSYVYWANRHTGQVGVGTIGRANLDGMGVNQSFITGATDPQGVAVDANYIYWANQNA